MVAAMLRDAMRYQDWEVVQQAVGALEAGDPGTIWDMLQLFARLDCEVGLEEGQKAWRKHLQDHPEATVEEDFDAWYQDIGMDYSPWAGSLLINHRITLDDSDLATLDAWQVEGFQEPLRKLLNED